MKKLLVTSTLLFSIFIFGQEQSGAKQFWENLQIQCGKSFEGEVKEGASNDTFRDKKLVMHVRNCDENTIRIPFFVGDDKSRTWVLTYKNDRIQLKHDHRHEDGSEDKVTQYGGTTSNSGSSTLQFFPADQETCELIPNASANVWWITLDETSFTYNLRRIGSDRLFTVKFDLTKAATTPSAPWGWKD
ncbi:hypothetical protein SAMN04488062_101119 [Flavobacterium omnivorum]|uniref:Secreted protein n=1 Tax=Flavobacterium omnivorum TaxID=178355 RepID=A0A1G7VQR3_9FLAO|nr:hypothetical protein [Flavobacterium omnivorum]SDG62152.1 hypothetical protein SAMN04488062_101119 [Flavobacterium omnivorum]